MFYWNYKNIYIVLSDEEEMELVRQLSGENVEDVIGYNIDKGKRKLYEKKIFNYFKKELPNNEEAFIKKYSERICIDEDAQKIFPVILDAYGRITKLATIGSYGGHELFDDIPESITLKPEETYYVTFFRHGRFPWQRMKPFASLAFPVLCVKKVVGTPDNFVLITDNFTIRFGRDFIRISIDH
jgi:hypothetical protein